MVDIKVVEMTGSSSSDTGPGANQIDAQVLQVIQWSRAAPQDLGFIDSGPTVNPKTFGQKVQQLLGPGTNRRRSEVQTM